MSANSILPTLIQHRHGDVLLTRVGECPPEHTDRHLRHVTVAAGEVSGHAHRIHGPGVALLADRVLIPVESTIDHEEHGLQVLVPGEYRVDRQRQWAPLSGWQRVRD